ncbi:unnamed protein product, partial [Ectocarpus fasciculatus]
MSRQVAVMCSIDLVVSFFLTIGAAGTHNSGFCQFQGFMLQWGFLGSVLWNVAMGNQIYRLIVKKKSEERLMKRLKVLSGWMVAVSLLVAVVLIADGRIGDAEIFCWIEADPSYQRFAGFFWFLLVSWTMSIYYFMQVSVAIKAHNHSSDGSHVALAENQIRSKLRTFLLIFIYVWFFTLLNNIVEAIAGKPVFVTSLLEALILPSQGLLNAIFYGGLLNDDSILWKILHMGVIGDKIMNKLGSDHVGGKSRRKSSIRNLKVWEKEIVNSPRKVSIFATTFNQGEATFAELGDFKTWIKPGHDIYSIGVQECMCLDEFRAGLSTHLGGPEAYTMFTTQIGSSNTRLGFHGYIALTVFIRTADIKSGAIKLVESASRDVASGANLIVTTAANKGAVGLLFHIHDITVGFVTAHLPSDSKGKSKLPKRNATAQDVLRELVLATDDLGCDVQHQHDYFFLMGDLNYRMNTPAGTTGLSILQLIAEAAIVEKAALDNDEKWIDRKYALMNGPASPDFPSEEEVEKLRAAAEAAEDAWDTVLLQDELKDMMTLGEVYSEFTEPMPRFPPSYKRKKGLAEASAESIAASEAAAVAAKEAKAKSKIRPPSYTDRILTYALPDRAEKLSVTSYGFCDEIRSSDHRPVCMAMQIEVNTLVSPLSNTL